MYQINILLCEIFICNFLRMGEDLFKYKFVFIPINENNHWYLGIICFPGLMYSQNEILTSVLIFDSLHQPEEYSSAFDLIKR